MDAVTFIRERGRLCWSYTKHAECGEHCPLSRYCDEPPSESGDAEGMVAAVEQWSKDHPLVTNGQKVMELIPREARFMDYVMDEDREIYFRINRDWWDAEYKEESCLTK